MTTTALSKFKPLTYTQHKLLDKAATALRKIRVVCPGLKLDMRS